MRVVFFWNFSQVEWPYHALNTVSDCFIARLKFQIFSKKINYDVQNFQAFTQILIDGQSFHVFNLIRGSDSQVYYKKAVLKSFKNFTKKKTLYMSLFWNKVGDLQPENAFIKRLLYRCFPIKFAKYFRGTFLKITSRWPLFKNVTSEVVFCILL